jgi:hypothetical protein
MRSQRKIWGMRAHFDLHGNHWIRAAWSATGCILWYQTRARISGWASRQIDQFFETENSIKQNADAVHQLSIEINKMILVQMNAKGSVKGITLMRRSSTFGKHLRTLGTILRSLRTPKQILIDRSVTLGTMVLGLTLVLACICNHSAPN